MKPDFDSTGSNEGLREVRRRDALLKAESLQQAILNSANFSLIATDAKGVIQVFNIGAERMLGYSAADVVNRTTPAHISDPEEVVARAKSLSAELSTSILPGFEALVFKASRGIEDIYELTFIRKDGSRFPAILSVTALRDAGEELIGYLLIGTDNTARKRVEAEQEKLDQLLRDKNAELERATIAAEKANLAKSDFLSSMSHELRSPLNAILGFAQLMESASPPASPSQSESIAQILRAGWHLLRLIDEILDLAKVESGHVPLSPEPVSLAEVLLECRDMLEAQARQHSVTLTLPGGETPHYVRADRTRVKQVLINFLSNAIKYNRPGGTVVVACRECSPERTRISITDSGIGLSSEQLAQLFQAFNRLGQEGRGEEGTGIGLVMARRLVELMGGTIGVESTVGVGSVFWFELKSSRSPEIAISEADLPGAAEPATPAARRARTVLYVEDNPANLKLVEQIIERRPDLRLLTAVTGQEGVALALANRPDVILMDLNLPDISGFEAFRILRENPAVSQIPVIAISANAMDRDIRKGRDAGFFRYMTKPIKVGEFLDGLDEALELPGREVGLLAPPR